MELAYVVPDVNRHKIIKTEKYWTNTADQKLIDILCGNTAFIFGYDNSYIVSKMVETQQTVGFLKGQLNETCDANDELINYICRVGNFDSLAWAVSGSDGVELAIYINDQYWKSKGENKPTVVVFNPGYHGTTYLTKVFRNAYPQSDRCVNVTAPAWETLHDRSAAEQASLEELKSVLKENPNIGGILMEACPWANGIKPWSHNWWSEVRSICDQYNVNFIVDDVFAGVGKLGYYFTHQRYSVQPDIAILAKSLTGGYSPLSCACVNKRISDVVKDHWDFGHTWSPNMAGVGAALAVKELFDETVIADIEKDLAAIGASLKSAGLIKNYISIGLLLQLDLNQQYSTDALIKNGLNGFVSDNNLIKICAPVIADREYFCQLYTRLEQVLLNK